MVGDSEYSIVTAQVWSHGLRIEELRIDEIDVVRRHMHGCRDESARRNDVVELTEGIYQLVLRLVIREDFLPFGLNRNQMGQLLEIFCGNHDSVFAGRQSRYCSPPIRPCDGVD